MGAGNPKGLKSIAKIWVCFRVMTFCASFNNISVIMCRSDLLMEETGVPEENHEPASSYRQTLSHNVVSSTPTCMPKGYWAKF